MSFLRRRLTCFYCNKPSKQSWSPGLTSFHCQLCDATNHLDENGEITDPPTPKASRQLENKRYAQNVASTSSQQSETATYSSPFCHTCTSNQQVVTQALAEYLPPTTDPKYREYERSYVQYKRDLEKRYPPVCFSCEPRVRAQLQQAGYIAKSDYMRRMLNKTKRMHPASGAWSRKHILGLIGLPLWVGALALPAFWNIFGLLAAPDDGLRSMDDDRSLRRCIQQAISECRVEGHCLHGLYDQLKFSMMLNALSIWWNPIMLRSTNRAHGLGEFYKLQLLLLVVRLASWYILGNGIVLDKNQVQAAHALLLTFNLVLTVVSLSIVRPKIRRPVDFSQDIPPLIEPGAGFNHTAVSQPPQRTIRQAQLERPGSLQAVFPIAKLGSKPKPAPYEASAPPLDPQYHDPDAMDIDEGPSQATTLWRESPVSKAISSSFLLRSAPSNSGPAQNARQFPQGGLPMKTRLRRKPSNFTMDNTTIADDETLAISDEEDEYPVDYDKAFIPASARNRKNYNFADSKLKVGSDETGLEGMFNDIFALKDDPLASIKDRSQIAARQLTSQRGGRVLFDTAGAPVAPDSASTPGKAIWHLLPVPVLASPAFVLTGAVLAGLQLGFDFRALTLLSSLGWTACIGAIRLVDALHPRRRFWELSNILVYFVESVLSVFVLFLRFQKSGDASSCISLKHATSTGPQDPVVGPDTRMLMDAVSATNRVNTAGADAVHFISLHQGMVLLLVWLFFQEVIVFRLQGGRLAIQLA